MALPGGAGYLLFYAGSAFPSPLPPGDHTAHLNCTASDVPDSDSQMLAEGNRIGVAFAPSLDAPFTALPDPVLRTLLGHWDSTRVSNPAALVFAKRHDAAALPRQRRRPAPRQRHRRRARAALERPVRDPARGAAL